MSVFRRMRDITVANLNERLEQSQDPVKLIDQFLHTTRDEIGEAERLYQQYASHTKQLQQQVNQATAMRNKREEQALLALKAGEDHLAKLALQEKIIHEHARKGINILDKALKYHPGNPNFIIGFIFQSAFKNGEHFFSRFSCSANYENVSILFLILII